MFTVPPSPFVAVTSAHTSCPGDAVNEALGAMNVGGPPARVLPGAPSTQATCCSAVPLPIHRLSSAWKFVPAKSIVAVPLVGALYLIHTPFAVLCEPHV